MKKIILNPGVFGGVLILAIMLISSLRQTAQKATTSTLQLRQLEQEVAGLKTVVDQKSLEASRAAQPYIKEKIARDQLLWQRPGEVVIELPATVPTPTLTFPTPTQTPWQTWQKILF